MILPFNHFVFSAFRSRLCGLKIRATTRGLLSRRGAVNAEKTTETENSSLRFSRLRLLSVLTLFPPHIFGAGPGNPKTIRTYPTFQTFFGLF